MMGSLVTYLIVLLQFKDTDLARADKIEAAAAAMLLEREQEQQRMALEAALKEGL